MLSCQAARKEDVTSSVTLQTAKGDENESIGLLELVIETSPVTFKISASWNDRSTCHLASDSQMSRREWRRGCSWLFPESGNMKEEPCGLVAQRLPRSMTFLGQGRLDVFEEPEGTRERGG